MKNPKKVATYKYQLELPASTGRDGLIGPIGARQARTQSSTSASGVIIRGPKPGMITASKPASRCSRVMTREWTP